MTELPPLREVIETHDLGAKKNLGQHFLLDLNLTAKVARAAHVAAGDIVLEIGPGPGGLTRALLAAGADVTAIERDARCLPALAELRAHYKDKLTIIESDALGANEAAILSTKAPAKIVANLPYNISTELLVKWLRAGNVLWSEMALMFQKEVADRILAAPGTKTYGRLSVISQAASIPSRAFDLPARAFTPPPKVASTVVSFAPPESPPGDLAILEKVTAAAFGQRRKMLRSSLKGLFAQDLEKALAAVGVAPTQRAEQVSVDQFKQLASLLAR